MEIIAETTSIAQDGLTSSCNVAPYTPTHHLGNGFLSFTEFLLRHVEEWSKTRSPLPPPPPPIAFSGSDRFIKGRLPHRSLAISASLSSLFDDATTILFDVCNHGDVHADNAIVKTPKMTRGDTVSKIHGDDDRAPAASTRCNTSIHTVSSDNAQKSDASVQVPWSNGMVDVSACSTDNSLEVEAACMCPQDGRSLSANETADVATCVPYNLLLDDSQHAHGSDDVTCQLLTEDDGVPNGFLCTTNKLEGSVHVPDIALADKSFLHMKNDEGGGKIASTTRMDAVVGHSLLLECKSSLPSPILRCDADGVAELPLPSLSKSPNDNNLTGYMGGVLQVSPSYITKSHKDNTLIGDADGLVKFSLPFPTKCYNDNNFTGSFPSSSECCNDNSLKGDTSAVPELSLPFTTKRHYDNNFTGDADGVMELSLPSVMNSLRNVRRATEGLSQLSLPSPWESNNANSLTGNAEGVAELQLLHSTTSDDVNVLQNTVMEAPIVLQQDEQVQALEEGEISERLSDDECLEMSADDGMTIGEGESHPPKDAWVELKAFESSTDDEMNQPISLFISRYRTQSSVNPSTQKMPPLDADSNIKTKVKTGNKRKIEEQEQLLEEVMDTDTAVKGKLKQAKGVQKGPSKVARVLNNNGGGLLGVASKVSVASKIDTSEAMDDVEKQYAEVGAAQAGRDQEAEVAMKKPKRKLTAERKKKRQQIKHRKMYERRQVGKLRLKPCIDKPKEKKACHFYIRGKCGKGASCPFSHDITPITKSEVCKYFINNCCLRGDDCPYSHALSTFPCKFFHTRGKCMEADSCRFSHEPISEGAKQKLLAKIEQEQQVHEANKVMDSDSFGHINAKHSMLLSDLELFPLGGKRATKTPLKVTDATASKTSRLDTTGISSTCKNISEIPTLVAAKKAAASTTIGGDTSVNATNLEGSKSLLRGSLLDPTGPLADKSSEKSTTRESGLPLAQTTGFSINTTVSQERKTKVDAFLQAQLDNSHLMGKSKLGTSLENSGGCYTLLNQPRALSMEQTSLLKAPNMSLPRNPNAKFMGSPHASADCIQVMPTSEPTICANTKPKSDFSFDQVKSASNQESVGIDASVPNRSVLGPSLLDLVSTSQRATFPKELASTSGLLSMTINAAPQRSTASIFLDRFLKG